MIIIGMLVVGVIFIVMGYSNTEYNGLIGERVLTKTGLSLRGFGNVLTSFAVSFLFPALTFAAWKTSRWRCQLARKMIDESSGPVHFSMPLIGSVNGWKAFWMAIALIAGAILFVALIANVSKPVEIRFGETTIDSCSLWATDVVGILYCVLWGVLLGSQAEEAEEVCQEMLIQNRSIIAERRKQQKEEWRKQQIQDILANMVSIPGKSYKMGRFEVSQAQWEAIMGYNPSEFECDDHPVERVSWNDCHQFVRKLNDCEEVKSLGLEFRLPTEEEWEFACRSDTTGHYCKLANGTEISQRTLGQVAWYSVNSNGSTHPVGQKSPNSFGLYDMHGNVWEWCQTEYNGFMPLSEVESYSIRGGGWKDSSGCCGASYCNGADPAHRGNDLGFRLCASV